MSTPGESGAHILVFPYPSPSHIIPILELTRLLLSRGLTVTVLVTPTYQDLLQPLLSAYPSSSLQTLLLSAPDPPASSPPSHPIIAKLRALSQLRHPILHWFRSHPTPPVAILSDFFLGWTHTLSCEIGVPRLVFSPSAASAIAVSNCLWRDLPKRDDPDDNNFLISLPNLPHSPIYPWWQIFFMYRLLKEGDPDWEFYRNNDLANRESWGVVFNSFGGLERDCLDHLKEKLGHDRVWAVGPLLPPDDGAAGPRERGGSSSAPTQEAMMAWLDGKAEESVVYVCFGTDFVLAEKQIEVLAAALECSGVHFAWCVKAKDEENMRIIDGLQDRVGGRGLIIRGWAPQVAILRHRAVGAFVTHCGWNSVMEGVEAGVVMLTWPLGADQYVNAKLLVDQLGIASRACEGGQQIVPDSDELSRLLASSVDRNLPERARVAEMREAALRAVKAGGSSLTDLDEFVSRIGELNGITFSSHLC